MSWRNFRERETPFVLTEQERAIVLLKRAGKTIREILEVFPGTSSQMFSAAIEKDRLIRIANSDKSRPGSASTLAQARRGISAIVEVRRGKWKNPLG